MTTPFTIDPRLTENTIAIGDVSLCHVRLMNDTRFPWLLLIPRRQDAVELVDLSPDDQALALADINRACNALRTTDWPGPVWGVGEATPFPEDQAQSIGTILLQTLKRDAPNV